MYHESRRMEGTMEATILLFIFMHLGQYQLRRDYMVDVQRKPKPNSTKILQTNTLNLHIAIVIT